MIELGAGLDDGGKAHLREALNLNPAFDPLGVERAREALDRQRRLAWRGRRP